jgi:hypothetical protein
LSIDIAVVPPASFALEFALVVAVIGGAFTLNAITQPWPATAVHPAGVLGALTLASMLRKIQSTALPVGVLAQVPVPGLHSSVIGEQGVPATVPRAGPVVMVPMTLLAMAIPYRVGAPPAFPQT